MGIELVLMNQRELMQCRLRLDKIISLIEYSMLDAAKVRSSDAYVRCVEIVSLLSPMDVSEGTYARIGCDFDGGYVMLDDFSNRKAEAAYSLGIDQDVSWDEAIAKRGIDVYMYDHTIERLPKGHPKFHYCKTGVTGYNKGRNLETLASIISNNNHAGYDNMILKMDIEGCEWDVFDETSSETIGRFSQIVVEFHGLSPDMSDTDFSRVKNVLCKINQTHQSIHVHANTGVSPTWIGGIVLPNMLEVTYVRRRDFGHRLVANQRQFPTEIDQPTFKGRPDLHLGRFAI